MTWNSSMTYPTYHNLIGGQWLPAASGKTILNLNPADHSDVVGAFPSSHAEDVALAVAAAKKAFATWRLVPAPKRAEILVRAGHPAAKRKEKYAREMTREMGKVLAETRGDVQEAIDEAFYVAGEGRRLFGQTTPSELPEQVRHERAHAGRRGRPDHAVELPHGHPQWKLFPALVAGNTCVIKPATDTPLSTYNLVRRWSMPGLPPGVVNIVSGTGSAAGKALVEHPTCAPSASPARAQSARWSRSAPPHLQAGLARDGRQERADRDRRRQPRTGARRRAVGRLRHHRPALHGHQPHPAAKGNCRRIYREFVARAKKLKVGNGLDESSKSARR
jgi:alpha-ketoglutaric semialdehyde dehydrogenase